MYMNQFKKDQLTTILRGAVLLLFTCLGILYCTKVKGQEIFSFEKDTVNNLRLISHTEYRVTEINGDYSVYFESDSIEEIEYEFTFVSTFTTSEDTTQVIYVVLKEVGKDIVHIDSMYRIQYPYVDAIYGYLIQKYKPYRVEYYDQYWKPVDEDDILHIKKRKSFKK